MIMKKHITHFILVLLFFCSLSIHAQSKKQTVENDNSNRPAQSAFDSDKKTATSTNTIITTLINTTNSDPTSRTGVSANITILAPDTTDALTNKKQN